jgi:hypothetical protein
MQVWPGGPESRIAGVPLLFLSWRCSPRRPLDGGRLPGDLRLALAR